MREHTQKGRAEGPGADEVAGTNGNGPNKKTKGLLELVLSLTGSTQSRYAERRFHRRCE